MPVQELSYLLVAADESPGGFGSSAQPGQQREVAPAPGSEAATAASLPALRAAPARYTHSLLRQTLQVMGAKPRQSDKAAQKVFLILQQRAALPAGEPLSLAARLTTAPGGRSGVILTRAEFDRLVLGCLAAAEPSAGAHQAPGVQPQQQGQEQAQAAAVAAPQLPQLPAAPAAAAPTSAQHPAPLAFSLEDLSTACALREQRSCVAVLLCGTSGTGKSTLAALLAARLGISTVVSTDSIRHMMRSFSSEAEDPLLWASTYQAGERLQQLAMQHAAAAAQHACQVQVQQRQAAWAQAQAQQQGLSAGTSGSSSTGGSCGGQHSRQLELQYQYLQRHGAAPGAAAAALDGRTAAVRGYKAQSARVLEHVDRLLSACEARRQSVVVEGVHLSLSMVVRMMQRHPSVLPFLVHISNEAKHMERFAVRSKVMTLRPDGNRYVQHFRNIRAIQDYLVKCADKHAIPKVDNTNVDRSVAAIHTTVMGCLRRTVRGESVLSPGSRTCQLLLEEYASCQSATWSSRGMLELIRSKSATGEVPSPTEEASTATAPASTPRGPLSEAALDEQLQLAGGGGSSAAAAGRGSTAATGHRGTGAAGRVGDAEDDEGDNRSFYGSDSQSSTQDGGGSSSCSCSTTDSEASSEAEEEAAAGHQHSPVSGRDNSTSGSAMHMQPAVIKPVGLPGLARRQRRRSRWRRAGGRSSSGSSLMGEIPAGPVPERLRQRSDVGSVLEPEPHSETEDAELPAMPELAVHA